MELRMYVAEKLIFLSQLRAFIQHLTLWGKLASVLHEFSVLVFSF